MSDDDYQKARQARLEQMRRQQEEEQKKREILKSILETEAFERIQNVRMANPRLYDRLVMLLMQLVQGGQIRDRVSDGQLRDILQRVQNAKPEPKITFKRK
ncbi:MAG: DNA-binding protein [Candidatus Micrarchaeota archaeon]|nr:DNA-binding protein [Candidatus Micrarchaeota archaeon]